MESTEDSMDASDCTQFGNEGLYDFESFLATYDYSNQ